MQAQIEDEQRVVAVFEFVTHGGAVFDRRRAQAMRFDQVTEQFAHVGFVVDDQYVRNRVGRHQGFLLARFYRVANDNRSLREP